VKETVAADGAWLPIAPPAQEVRYIPANTVPAGGPITTTSATPVGSGFVAPAAAAVDPLWAQAEQAERNGNGAEAERLYLQLAKQTNDHDLSMRCYNRAHFLRQGMPTLAPTGGSARLTPSPNYQPAYYPTAQATSQYTYVKDTPNPVGQAVGYGQRPAAPAPVVAWKGPGVLRRTGMFMDGKPAYALETNQERMYATPQQGVDLEPYVNRAVSLYGPILFRGDVRTNYMTVTHLAPAQ